MDQAPKSALIVDDSQTARHMLGKVLERHHVRVAMAASAEEALDYLNSDRPDVIFMDHLMPGMDGFQAVRAIKNNPATATIPIMMYTSQAGELYVGQARALGAVGVLPKQIRPVQVADTLKSLNLIPVTADADSLNEVGAETEVIPEADVDQTLSDVEQMMEPADWGELHSWFEEMLSHHQDAIRADIEASVARVLRESAADHEETFSGTLHKDDQRLPGWLSGFNATTLLVLALSVFAAIFFWLYLDTQKTWQTVYAQNMELINSLQSNRAAELNSAADELGKRELMGSELEAAVREIEWQINLEAAYDPDKMPLGDSKLEVIEKLMNELRALGFSGIVQLDSHIGDFCYVQTSDGNWKITGADEPVTSCEKFGIGQEDALTQSAKQSVAFANYVAANDGSQGSLIRIVVNPLGNTRPVIEYPDADDVVTAGEWNRIARINNFVLVRLIPDFADLNSQVTF